MEGCLKYWLPAQRWGRISHHPAASWIKLVSRLSTSRAEYLILPFLQQDLGFRNSTHSLAMPKFNLKLRSSWGSGIGAERSQLCCIWALLCALKASHRKVSSKFRFLGHLREILSDLEEEVASQCLLLWDILVTLSPRTAGILKHSTRTKPWLFVQNTEQMGLLPLAGDWRHWFKVRTLLSSLEIGKKYWQTCNVLALLKTW